MSPGVARDEGRTWSVPLRTGSLPHTLLTLLADRPHPVAYLVLAAKTEGIYITEAKVLATLKELERRGHVAMTWRQGAGGPPESVYALTERGRQRLATLQGQVRTRQADY